MPDPTVPAESTTEREVRAGLCGQGLVPGGFPVPGQQLVHPGVRQLGGAGEDAGAIRHASSVAWTIVTVSLAHLHAVHRVLRRLASSRYSASGLAPISLATIFQVPLGGTASAFQAIHASKRSATVRRERISARSRVA